MVFKLLLVVAATVALSFGDADPVETYHMGSVDMLFTPEQQIALNKRSAYINIKKWPNATIPYIVDAGFQAIPSRMAALTTSIAEYNKQTCIRLVPRTNQKDYVKFINGGGCYSYLGVTGGEQPISWGNGCDTTKGTPLHEIMHCLGFMHEQQRPDRDNYVTIDNSNVMRGTEGNFQKVAAKDADLLGINYELSSIMHYPDWAFAIDTNKKTITTKNSADQSKIGQRADFTACDIAKINKFYSCPSPYKNKC